MEDHGNKVEISEVDEAETLVNRAGQNPFVVTEVKNRERTRKPAPPFITSTLQQEASRRLRLAGTRTMRIAQQLYEGIELGAEGSVGLITYMRTDSPRIAPEAVAAVREYVEKTYGKRYVPDQPHYYRGKKTAQDAHEAIRPTSMALAPQKVAPYLDKWQLALYTLIWNRFTACQAAPAIFDQTTANIASGELLFRVSGSVMKFDGFTRIYSQSTEDEETQTGPNGNDDERSLPALRKGDILELQAITPRQHFTQPPPLFNEASLIKELEELGLGRPSTYAETVSTIQRRKYVELVEKRFHPTLLGRIIAELLADSFPRLLNTRFTAEMESSLDLIEEGRASWIDTLKDFYDPFVSDLSNAKKAMKNIKREGITTGEACPDCGKPLLVRSGRYGLFLGCSAYPDCAHTRNIPAQSAPTPEAVPTDKICECGSPMVMKQGKAGPFLACSRYPECRVARPVGTGVKCPKCGKGELVQRRTKKGKFFYACDKYPECDYSLWNKPVEMKCPNQECGWPVMEQRSNSKSGSGFFQCPQCKAKASSQT